MGRQSTACAISALGLPRARFDEATSSDAERFAITSMPSPQLVKCVHATLTLWWRRRGRVHSRLPPFGYFGTRPVTADPRGQERQTRRSTAESGRLWAGPLPSKEIYPTFVCLPTIGLDGAEYASRVRAPCKTTNQQSLWGTTTEKLRSLGKQPCSQRPRYKR